MADWPAGKQLPDCAAVLLISPPGERFLRRVVADQAFPLELKVPNAATRAAMEESRAMMAARRARFSDANALFADLEEGNGKKAARASVDEVHALVTACPARAADLNNLPADLEENSSK